MQIRDATAADWPLIWPFLRGIVAAGETFTWPSDVPDDRRRVLIEPTPDGLARVSAACAGLIERTREDLDAFDDDELSTLVRYMRTAEHSTAAEIQRLQSAPDDVKSTAIHA